MLFYSVVAFLCRPDTQERLEGNRGSWMVRWIQKKMMMQSKQGREIMRTEPSFTHLFLLWQVQQPACHWRLIKAALWRVTLTQTTRGNKAIVHKSLSCWNNLLSGAQKIVIYPTWLICLIPDIQHSIWHMATSDFKAVS